MTTKSCNQSTTPPQKLSLRSPSALGVAAQIVLLTSLFWVIPFINVLVLFGSNPAFADTSVEEGFESGSIAAYKSETQGSGSFQIVSGGAREGNNFLRITKNKGARRYELRLAEHSKPTDLWYGFSLRLQSDMQNTDEYFFINQWHQFPDSGEKWHKPDTFFRLNPDYKTGISNRWDSRRITPDSEPDGEGRTSDLPLLNLNRGQWYDFVVRYKYSYNSDGLIEVYGVAAGGQLQLLQRLAGPNCFNDARGQFRIGLYAEEDDFTAYIDYDNIRIGTSLNEVKPR